MDCTVCAHKSAKALVPIKCDPIVKEVFDEHIIERPLTCLLLFALVLFVNDDREDVSEDGGRGGRNFNCFALG